MYLKEINIINNKYYDDLVINASIFSNAKWIAMYGSNVTTIGIFNNNHDLIGTFYVKIKPFLGFKIYQTASFSPHCGLYFINPSINPSSKITFEKDVMTLISNYLNSNKNCLTIIAFPYQYEDMHPFILKKHKVVPNYTYQLNLELSNEAIFANYSSERRKSIKKAIKDHLICEKITDYKIVKDLILKTFSRKEKTIDVNFLDKILFEFADSNNSFAYVSYKNELPIATTFCIYNNQACYYLFGGYDTNHKHHGAGPLCMHNSIIESKTKNIPIFDFEGSMLPEVEKYFREFGGELKPYYIINKAFLPIEIILKLVKQQQF